jgi:Flp pilus assembly protein TadG
VDTLKLGLKKRRNDDGVELIELAIVMPILVLLLIGIVDFAFLFQRWEVVTNATREGARLASLQLEGDLAQEWDDAEVTARVQSFLSSGGLRATPTVGVDFTTSDDVGGVAIDTVTVSVTYPSDFIFLPGSINLTGTSEMRRENIAP